MPSPSALPTSALVALLALRAGVRPLEEVLQDVVGIARGVLPGADEVSTTLVRRDRPRTAASTGPLSLEADELQYEHGHGPCVEAAVTGTVLSVEDTRSETRWPGYTGQVVQRGVLSSLSLPLPLQTDVVGALNCYSRSPQAFSRTDVERGLELAGHIAVAVGNTLASTDAARLAEDMRAAMSSRAVIEQAKGVVMAQNRCDADAAFAVLSRASQARNVRLRDLAAEVVAGVTRPAQHGQGTRDRV